MLLLCILFLFLDHVLCDTKVKAITALGLYQHLKILYDPDEKYTKKDK